LLRVFIINQNHHGRGLVLSGSCQVRKSEFLLHQYPESASLKLHGQFRNDDSHATHSIAVSDPAWWNDYFDYTAYIDCINPESVANRVHQESRIALASVSPEIPCAKEVGTDSVAAFQTASQPSGFCQQSLGVNGAANFDNNLEQKALSACPDGTNRKDSISLVQLDWNSMISPLALRSDCDFHGRTSRGSTPLWNETFCQESQEKRKIQISILNPFKCTHCSNPFSSEQRLRYVLLL
jgi:hypothetical protein